MRKTLTVSKSSSGCSRSSVPSMTAWQTQKGGYSGPGAQAAMGGCHTDAGVSWQRSAGTEPDSWEGTDRNAPHTPRLGHGLYGGH